MTDVLHAAPRPCNTCPYVKATPPGIWSPEEYQRLAEYDADPGPYNVFGCHQGHITNLPTVCRGWLSVHPDTLAVRIAIAQGRLTVEQRDAEVPVELYGSGIEAARAGIAGVAEPSEAARRAIATMVAKSPAYIVEGDR